MKNKGFVITLDALMAVGIALILFSSVSFYLSKAQSQETENLWLKQIAGDTISVLDKGGKLEQAILQNNSVELRQVLNKLPYGVCADLFIYPDTNINNPILFVVKDNCETSTKEIVSSKRSILVESSNQLDFYIGEVNVWRKET